MLRAFHRRQLVHGGLQRAAGADGEHDGIGVFQPALDFRRTGLGNADRGGNASGIARHHLDISKVEFLLQPLRLFETGGDGMIEPDLDQPLGDGQRYQPLRRLPGYAHGSGDLVLRAARDIIKPASTRRIIKPSMCVVPSGHAAAL
ncbi:hypothetical protein D3C86_1537390 [compost metagenome]